MSMGIGNGGGMVEWESIQVELTSKCNLRCKMCALTAKTTASSADPGVINDDAWNAVMNAAPSCGEVIIAGYGEPLMDSRCVPFLEQLDELGVNIAISTNGNGIATEVARSVMTLEHLKTINVSIDSPDAESYRRLRGGSLDRAMRGLGRLVDQARDIKRSRCRQ
jgi:MoaA/NifB/PqqE/SkfB family radical SAM enzyme